MGIGDSSSLAMSLALARKPLFVSKLKSSAFKIVLILKAAVRRKRLFADGHAPGRKEEAPRAGQQHPLM